MGGSYSHEFQLLTEAGEDKLISCNDCDYIANSEVARTVFKKTSVQNEEFKKIRTPSINTVSKLSEFLKISPKKIAKVLLFETKESKKLIVCFIRGELNALESKIRSLVNEDVHQASHNLLLKHNITQGYVGPFHLAQDNRLVLIDKSLMTGEFFVTGANEEHSHYKGFSPERDFLDKLSPIEKDFVKVEDISEVTAGFSCPKCPGTVKAQRGIEIGNIFDLGTRYSSPLKAKFLDKDAKQKPFVMGCYGIGITRVFAAIIEEHHDDYGPIFPITVAPFEIHICPLKYKNDSKVTAVADELYENLKNSGIQVLLDDSQDKPGSQFANADLIGVPIRVIISTKGLEKSHIEIKFRDKRQDPIELPYLSAKEELVKLVHAEYKKYLFT
jgi:prolyl-tRNA synthetase